MSFNAYHTKVHDALKHQLSPAKLDVLFSDLNTRFSKHIVNSWGEAGIQSIVLLAFAYN